jgi:hypothetical protein
MMRRMKIYEPIKEKGKLLLFSAFQKCLVLLPENIVDFLAYFIAVTVGGEGREILVVSMKNSKRILNGNQM